MQVDITGYNLAEYGALAWYENSRVFGNGLYYENGHCLLPLQNPQGTLFYTIIDKSNTMMFDPKVWPMTASSSGNIYPAALTIKCGLIVIDEGTGVFTIMNTSGDTVFVVENVDSVSDFNEDIAMVRSGGMVYYIDKTGQRLF